MSIELTDEQRQAVMMGQAVHVNLPEAGGEIVLLRADQYEDLRELQEDQREQQAFRRAGLQSAMRWMKDNPY